MKISTIMVCYNSEETIAGAIESFLAQTYRDKELVLIDGKSTDSTLEIIQSFLEPGLKVFSEKDAGIYDAMNKGLSLFSGDAFGFLNSDDRYSHPNVLSKVVESLNTADIVSGHIQYCRNHTAEPINQTRIWKSSPFSIGSFKKGWIIPHPATYAVRQVYDCVGNFDTSYKIAGDYEWILRTLEVNNFSHGVIDDIIVDMKLGGASTSGVRALLTNSLEPLRARRKWLNSGVIDAAIFYNVIRKLAQLRPMGMRR
ncbi:hypothetical protein A9Q96_00290 [Rhodobacterales bacterium 52_120_T64]|nr:hypothetical protein A9Q96_00290 [Rhodobacterales bacterium 52_120_T64]